MEAAAILQTVHIEGEELELYVPDEAQVEALYRQGSIDFPYWSQVWPAARSMSAFLLRQPQWVRDKKVLEIAGGLGLPSLAAARFAKEVWCSDYVSQPLQYVQRSAAHCGYQHLHTTVIDWNNIPDAVSADVLLLSDVNYAPAQFDALEAMVHRFLNEGTTVIITTPQRLMAKPFIEALMSFTVLQHSEGLTHKGDTVGVSLFVLQKSKSGTLPAF